jgi:hypothetical protein
MLWWRARIRAPRLGCLAAPKPRAQPCASHRPCPRLACPRQAVPAVLPSSTRSGGSRSRVGPDDGSPGKGSRQASANHHRVPLTARGPGVGSLARADTARRRRPHWVLGLSRSTQPNPRRNPQPPKRVQTGEPLSRHTTPGLQGETHGSALEVTHIHAARPTKSSSTCSAGAVCGPLAQPPWSVSGRHGTARSLRPTYWS